MKSGYKVFWTAHALEELRQTIQYLESEFTPKEIERLAYKIEFVIRNISRFPDLYPESSRMKRVRRAVVTKFNTIYYRVDPEHRRIEVLSFFSNRQDGEKLEL